MEPSRSRKRTKRKPIVAPFGTFMTEVELARLGGGHLAYIRAMSSEQARELFPTIEGLPVKAILFTLHAADGTPIALTDSRQAAIGHAMDGELEIASIH